MRDEGSWNHEQLGELIIGDLSKDGLTLAIGTPWNDENGEDSGQVRVYRINDNVSTWQELGQVLMGENTWDWFGWSLTFSDDGNTLAIGVPLSGGSDAKYSGHVRIYGLDADDLIWIHLGQDIIGLKGDHQGECVSLSADGKTVAIGAMHNDDKGVISGHTMVYIWDESALTYKQLGHYITGEKDGHLFGISVSLSSNGTALAVGAWLNHWCNEDNGEDAGHVKVYKIDNSTLLY